MNLDGCYSSQFLRSSARRFLLEARGTISSARRASPLTMVNVNQAIIVLFTSIAFLSNLLFSFKSITCPVRATWYFLPWAKGYILRKKRLALIRRNLDCTCKRVKSVKSISSDFHKCMQMHILILNKLQTILSQFIMFEA